MNLKNRLNIISGFILLFCFSLENVKAEGTKELSPTAADSVMLHTNAAGFGDFASFVSFGTSSSLNLRITDATNDSIYVGLSAEASDFGVQNSSFTFRILDPTGAVAFGPFTVGLSNANASTWALAANGPDVNGMGGYSTNTGTYPYSRFKPTMTGDYVIQFDDGSPFNIVNVLFYDFTVRNSGVVKPGRLWSRNWALRTPPIMANTPPECQFDRPFNGLFYSYTMDGFVSKIDFLNSDFQGLSFTVSFGDRGPGDTGDVIADRRSVNDMNATANNADHMVFLSDPDNVEFPSSTAQCGDVALINVSCEIADSFCINIGVTQPGQVEIILDFVTNGIFDMDTTDVILAMFFTTADTVCIPWNGLKGDGSPVGFGESVPTIVRYSQGVQHYAGFDVEFLKTGFCVQTIRPICPGIATDLLYWDDSQITDDVVTVTIDEGDPGTGQPKVQFNGCICGIAGCRSWDNFQIGDPPSGTCVGTPFGYGENATLNTWWFASTTVITGINLPFIQVVITGDSAICNGDSTIFTAVFTPDTIDYIFEWSGPGGFMATTVNTGNIGMAGTYYVTITDTLTNCSAVDSAVLIVFSNPTTSIGFTCLGANQSNANVNLDVMGGQSPYSYLWSNGAMTQDLTNVPPGTYSVIVTDANGCMAFDTILVEGCCELIIVCPPSNGGSFQCAANVPVLNTNVVTVTEFCNTVTVTGLESNNGGSGCTGNPLIITRTYTVLDGAGNSQTCTQTFTVVDNLAPAIVCPANVTIQCTASTLPANTGTATATDNCDATPTITRSDVTVAGMCPQERTITRTWVATDDCGNSSSCAQTIFVDDSISPVITCPGNITIQCTASTLPANTGTATATDNCDSTPTITSSDVSVGGSCPQERTITRTWLATDDCGNTSTCVQTIVVDDSSNPVITCPANLTILCTASTLPANTGTATATDNCDATPTLSFTDVTVGGACAQERTITRTWRATDDCGNTSTCQQTIIVDDNAAPTISCPGNITIQCSASTLPANTGTATATDNCTGTPTITFSDVIVGGTCPQERTITRTWLASDGCGNSSTCVQTIVVDDSVGPQITCPVNVTIQCTASTLPANTGTATATDNCDATPTITSSDVNVGGTCPQERTITRTWVAVDDCGNSSSCVQTIFVDDSVAPAIVCPANVVIACTGSTLPATTGTATATDNCDATPTINFSDVTFSGSCPQGIAITRTWIATDDCGNSSTCVQNIVVDDIVGPALVCPIDMTIECTASTLPANTGTATVTDNCDATPTLSFSDVTVSGACAQERTISRTWLATDDCGNTSTCLQTIVVDDSTAPAISCPGNITIQCTASTLPSNTGTATATDNCTGTPSITFSDVTVGGTCPQERTITRTWLASDGCGNSSTCNQIIVVDDSVAPQITCPANLTIQCTASTLPANTGTATATDNCDSTPTITSSDVIVGGTCPQERTITRTWVAIDDCGNSSNCVQTIVVDDSMAPTLTCPGNVTILCTASTLPANTGVATATDNCDATPTITSSDVTVAGACAQERTITRTWIATDDCGNSATCLQIIVVDDNAAPGITCPPAVTVTCASAVPPVNIGSVTTTDNCSAVAVTHVGDVTSNQTCANSFIVTRTYRATDACGNSATCAQIITVNDLLPPSITCPANTTVSCANLVPAVNTGSVITNDNCGAGVTVTHLGDVISNQTCANRFTVTRTYRAMDACGNSASCTQIITVNDQTPPTAICQNITIDFASGTEVTITPEQIGSGSSDNCGSVTLSLSQTVFTCDQFIGTGSVPVTLTVTDQCGNTSTCVAQVMGTGGLLEITCPADIIIYLDAGECTAFVNYVVTAEAICGGTPILTQIDITGLTSGDAFPIGTTIQTWQATNNSATAECSFNITVFEYDGPIVLGCNDTINVSVDNNCEVHLFADMILEGDQYGCYDDYIITIENVGTDTGWIVFSGLELLNGCYNVTITDPDSGNSCWGVVCIEDKIPPQILCACPPGEDGADTCQISCLEVDILLNGNIPPNLYPTIIENCGYILEVSNIELNDQGCGQSTVVVSWLVTDLSGLTATCDQEFAILPLSSDSLVFPPNYIGPCGSSSDPEITGWPQIGGYDLTDEAGLCNLFLGYWDKALEDCGGGQKILRTWTVLDWCTIELTEGTQIIKLSDTEGPVLTCPADITIGTDFWYCHADVSVPKPIAYDACSDIVTYELYASEGFIVHYGNNYVINGLELGTHSIAWIVTDECGNSSSCTFTITVVDDVAPVANCDQHTIVSLTNDGPMGVTLVPASVFDDGSYDNCGPVSFKARRMDSCIDFDWTTNGSCIDDIPDGYVNSNDQGTSRKPCVPFACCDVPRTGSRAEPIMVELEVTDQAGNKNYCMVEVEVQDKISPEVICLPDILVSCDFWFPAEEGVYRDAAGNQNGNLDEDPLSSIFGNMYDALTYEDDQSVRQPIIINDPGNTNYPQPHLWGFDGWADDNCLSDLEVRVKVYSDCTGDNLPANPPPGAIKLIERRFTARDNQEGFSPSVCTQRIWVVDFEPFYISDNSCNNSNPNDGVRWPCDILITNCPDEFGSTGEPQIYADACSLIGVTYEDTRFEISDGACYKILREWKVIDWCQYNSSSGYGLWSYTQVIKVHDKQAAEFLQCPQQPVVLCVEDDGVRLPATNQVFLGENDPNASSCSVHVTMTQRIRESCNQQVAYDVKVYPFNGTEFLLVIPRTVVQLDENHDGDLVFNTEESAIQSIRRNGLPYNSQWCGDYHRILWSVEDGCGNWSHCEYLFRLEDCKQPSPVCIQGLSTVVMPVGCEVTLWAKDFNASSADDCTPSANLLYSFSGDSYEPSKTFNSTNIPAFGVELSIQIWVADGGTDDNCNGAISWTERNKDYCTTTVVFNDNTGNCDHSGSIVYEGEILTYHNDPVEAVKVSLVNNNETVYAMNTVDNGKYVLVVPEIDGQRYAIVPKRLDQPRNGVSTLDLVRIQKHLLGKEFFDSPYQYIAADANNNEQISAIDLIEIRKLILGIYVAYPNNDSWRFVDKNAQIANPQNPWPFEEVVNIQYDGNSISGMDFIGVKIGDVNNSVQANALQIFPRNGRRMLTIGVESPETVVAGEVINLELTLPEKVAGFQWTLETTGLEYAGIRSEDVVINDQHVGVLGNGVVTMSWFEEDLTKVIQQEKMTISLQFVATQSGNISDMIRLSDKVASSEAYTFKDEIVDLQLESNKANPEIDFALYQNEPNPWSGSTTISFELPADGLVKLTIVDIAGKTIKVIEGMYTAGHQSITFLKKDVPNQGVLYYRIDSGNYSATKKMIRIE